MLALEHGFSIFVTDNSCFKKYFLKNVHENLNFGAFQDYLKYFFFAGC